MVSSADLATLRIEDFAPHGDGVFEMQTADGVVPLKLETVAPAGASGRAGGAFSLLFVAFISIILSAAMQYAPPSFGFPRLTPGNSSSSSVLAELRSMSALAAVLALDFGVAWPRGDVF